MKKKNTSNKNLMHLNFFSGKQTENTSLNLNKNYNTYQNSEAFSYKMMYKSKSLA